MRIKKNGKTINLTEADIKKLTKSILKEQNPDELKKLIDNYALKKNPKELEKLTDVQIKTEIGDQNLTPEQIESIRALIKNAQQGGGSVKPGIIGKIQTPQTSESVIKIKKGGDTFNLTESDIKKLNVFLLTEQRAGIIQQGDTDFCLIVCDVKHAKYGSNGEMVKKIQHLLAANGFNEEFVGGGMESGCDAEWPVCDGKFRKHTKDAVEEFQTNNKLKPDGIVGPLTLKKMCELLMSTHSLMKKPLCPDCNCDDQRPGAPVKELPDQGDGQDKSWSVDECMVVKECIKKIWSREGTTYGNEWEQLKECLTKRGIYIKREIELNKKDIPKNLYDKLTLR